MTKAIVSEEKHSTIIADDYVRLHAKVYALKEQKVMLTPWWWLLPAKDTLDETCFRIDQADND